MVRFSNAINDYSEKVLLIESNNTYMIYDFMDTTHSKDESKEDVLAVEEYAKLRINYEASAKDGSISPESIPAGGYVSPNNLANSTGFYWPIVVLITLLAIISCFVSRKMKRK